MGQVVRPDRLPAFVQAFTDRHGKPRYYFRRRGFPRLALPGLPWSTEFMDALGAALDGRPIPASDKPDNRPGTLRALAASYFESIEFANLGDTTKATYTRLIGHLCREHGDSRVAALTRQHIDAGIERRKAQPGVCKDFRNTMRVLMRRAMALGWRETDPTAGVKIPASHNPDGFHSWTPDEVERFEARWSIGTKERLAFELLISTGQRRGDVIRMGRQHVRGSKLFVRQGKTSKKGKPPVDLLIPILPSLAAAIERAGAGMTFLLSERGAPMHSSTFNDFFAAAVKAAGLPKECTPHGLRKACAARLADHGCTHHEIMAITGHRSLKELERYTRKAAQERLAESAFARLKMEA